MDGIQTENPTSHGGSIHMRVRTKGFIERKSRTSKTNSHWRKAAYHFFFLPLSLTHSSYLHLILPVPMVVFAWAPDSRQLSGLWGSYQCTKPDALSLGSWLHTVPLLPLPTQTVHWAPNTEEPHCVSSLFFFNNAEKEKEASGVFTRSLCTWHHPFNDSR